MFCISNCATGSHVKFATCTLLDGALTWMVLEEEDKIESYIWGLPDNIQWKVTLSKLTRLQYAIKMENNLMDQKIKSLLVIGTILMIKESYEYENGFVFADISIGADIHMYADKEFLHFRTSICFNTLLSFGLLTFELSFYINSATYMIYGHCNYGGLSWIYKATGQLGCVDISLCRFSFLSSVIAVGNLMGCGLWKCNKVYITNKGSKNVVMDCSFGVFQFGYKEANRDVTLSIAFGLVKLTLNILLSAGGGLVGNGWLTDIRMTILYGIFHVSRLSMLIGYS
nr:hypothetical protein [Tanacetum cinerariifolium]